MIENTNKDLQNTLLKMVIELHEFCENNNIDYYMLGGTMLGAVRHRGFIPWDDDIDIGMKRDDYDRFVKLYESKSTGRFHLKTFKNSNDLLFPYSKLMNKQTTLVENRLGGIIGGVYIDIFPIDGSGTTYKFAVFYYKIFYFFLGLLYNSQDIERKSTIFRRLFQNFSKMLNPRKLIKLVDSIMRKFSFEKSKYISNFSGAWGTREIVTKDVFGKPTLYDFESTQLYGVSDPDSYLKSLYGNYFELPPIEKRYSHHDYLYINLELPYSDYSIKSKYEILDMENE